MDTIRIILEFLVYTVIVKAIVAHYIARYLVKWAKKWVGSTERNTSIWMHYQKRAAGEGHQSDSVLTCREERCTIFA